MFVHGFTQTADSWKPIAARFAADGYEAVVVDAPGHGGSADVRADLRRAADMLTDAVRLRRLHRLQPRWQAVPARRVACTRTWCAGSPSSAHRPGIADETERADRRAADERLGRPSSSSGRRRVPRRVACPATVRGARLDDEQRARSADQHRRRAWRAACDWPAPVRRLAVAAAARDAHAGPDDLPASSTRSSRRSGGRSRPPCRTAMVEIPGAGHAAHLQHPVGRPPC